jgi:hypothetical protein
VFDAEGIENADVAVVPTSVPPQDPVYTLQFVALFKVPVMFKEAA